MNDLTVPTFTRHYKYTYKDDEVGFLTKYFVTSDVKPINDIKLRQRSPQKQL